MSGQFQNLLLSILCIGLQLYSYAQPLARFSASQLSGCSPLTVNFSNTSTGATSFNWNFGNGNTSTLSNPSANFIVPGTYTVTLNAQNGNLSNTQSLTITVFENPKADFILSQTKACENDPICFNDLSIQGSAVITNWSWDFGDGNTSSAKNPCHSYAAPGVYTVVLVVTDQNGCTHNKTLTNAVTVSKAFTANFNQTTTFSCKPPHGVTFTPTVTPPGSYAYQWDFGNGSSSTSPNPFVNYTTEGIFTVKVTIASSNGCVRVIEKPNLVRIGKPKADFVPNITSGCEPLTVRFTNQTVPDTSGVTYIWQTSTGHSSTNKHPEFTFNAAGEFWVRLIARYANGCSDTLLKNKLIRVFKKPVSEFTADKRFFCKTPAKVTFNAVKSDTSIIKYEWNFGDNSSDTGSVISHTYQSKGKYTVKLIVTTRNGCMTEYIKDSFIVIEDPNPTSIIMQSEGCFPRLVRVKTYDDNSAAPVNIFTYLYRDTIRAIDSVSAWITIPIYVAGEFDLTVFGRNSDTCETITVFKIKSGYPLVPIFKPDTNRRCIKPGIIDFSNTTIIPDSIDLKDITWEWNFGDGDESTDRSPKHQYKQPGTYVVKLVVKHKGCYKEEYTAFDTIYILNPIAKFVYTDLKCGEDTVIFSSQSIGVNKWLWTTGSATSNNSQFLYYPEINKHDTVKLIVYDTISGCSDTSSVTIYIPQKPDIKISGITPYICKPFRLIIIDSTDYSMSRPVSIAWTINNEPAQIVEISDTSSLYNKFLFTTNNPGIFKIKLTVTDSLGCDTEKEIDTAFTAVNIRAKFSKSATLGCIPFNVTFIDESQSDLPIKTKRWDWGNGIRDTSLGNFKSYTYLQTPLNQTDGFIVTLYIKDSAGCSDSTSQLIYTSRPPASFTITKSKFCDHDSLYMRWRSSGVNGMSPYQYNWTIDDTLSATSFANIKNFYEESRTVNIKLKVTDANSCTDSTSSTVVIDNRKPIADFTANPPFIECPGKPIAFIDKSVRGATPIVKWNWEFGDSSKSVLQNPSKIYLFPNKYTVSLSITDSAGCKSTSRQVDFAIVNGPRAIYSISPKIGCSPLTTGFNLSAINTKLVEWDMGDGVIKNDTQFQYTYNAPRSYIPFLILTDSNNCRVGFPLKDTIIVHATPVANFDADKNTLCAKEVVQIKNLSKPDTGIVSKLWHIGDSSFFNDINLFSVQINKAGKYKLGLKITDNNGCTDEKYIDPMFTVYDDTVAPKTPTIIRTSVLDNNATTVEWNMQTEPVIKYYTLHHNYLFGEPMSQKLFSKLTDTTFIQTSINTLHNTYSYSLTATDYCSNTSEFSETHTTIELTAKGVVFANELRWNNYKGWATQPRTYEVYKLNFITNEFEKYAQVPGNTIQYIDSSALCNVVSYYRVKALFDETESIYSWSDTSGSKPLYVNTIPTPEHIRVTVEDNVRILLQWKKKTHTYALKTLVYRSIENKPPVFIAELDENDTSFVDNNVDVQTYAYTYHTVYKDVCGGLSPYSNPSKSILLKVEPTSGNSFPLTARLDWNKYELWQDGINNYTIINGNERIEPPRTMAKVLPEILRYIDEMAIKNQTEFCYKIIAYPNDTSNLYSESNIDCISTKPRLFAPNVFTVNQDGLNETFRLGGYFIETFYIEIYNRLGERIFESDDITNSWDGTFNNKPCASDVYVYIAKATGYNGDKIEIKGNVTLLR